MGERGVGASVPRFIERLKNLIGLLSSALRSIRKSMRTKI